MDAVKATSNYLANFKWKKFFWQPTNGSLTMHVLLTQGRDRSRGVAQLWLIGQLEFAILVMKKTDYWMVRICITNIDRTKLKTGLKTTRILGDVWSTSCIEPVISVLAKPNFVHSRINPMSKNHSKAKDKALSVYKDGIFPFMYNVRTTDSGEFLDHSLCDVSIFRPETNVAIELQIDSRNFNTIG